LEATVAENRGGKNVARAVPSFSTTQSNPPMLRAKKIKNLDEFLDETDTDSTADTVDENSESDGGRGKAQ
jgi:hypothetical protein